MRRSSSLKASPIVFVLLSTAAGAAFGFDVKPAVQQSLAGAQRVESASIGYVAESTGPVLRSILGVPGSARFSDPIPLPDGTTAIEVAPGHLWALLTRNQDLTSFDPATGSTRDLGSGIPDSFAFSPSGARVALYFQASGTVELYSGLPLNPTLESTTTLAQAADAFAVSDNAGFAYTAAGKVYFNAGNATDQFLYESSSLGPLAFEAGADSVVLFDSTNGKLIEAAISGKATRTVASGFGSPDRLFAWTDHVAAGDSLNGVLWTIDSATGAASAPVAVAVSRIVPTQARGILMVSSADAEPAWLAGPQGISFVPAVQ